MSFRDLPESFLKQRIQSTLIVHHELSISSVLRQVIAEVSDRVQVREENREAKVLSICLEWRNARSDQRRLRNCRICNINFHQITERNDIKLIH